MWEPDEAWLEDFYRSLMHGPPLGDRVAGARPRWQAQAACRGKPTEWWFPLKGESTDEARAICDSCPVKAPCGDYGLGEMFGVWGGTSGRERKALRGEREREAG